MSAIEALPAQQDGPVRGGMRSADGVSAWRQVFDREQMAALNQFHSVQARAFAAASSGRSMAPGALDGLRVAPAGTAVASAPARADTPFDSVVREAVQAAAPAGPLAAPRHVPGQALAGMALRAARSVQPAGVTDGTRLASHVAPLAALQEKWPWRKLHCMVGADGLHLWLRDAGATPQDPALQRWLGELQCTLSSAGIALASFTLNGRACPVPPIVS